MHRNPPLKNVPLAILTCLLFTGGAYGQSDLAHTIIVTGVTQLKLNLPTPFVATVKDSRGNVLSNPNLTWLSSNPDVATVDANGWVTAKNFGKATISASIVGSTITGSSPEVNTYGLKVYGGVRSIFTANRPHVTALLVRFRAPNGAPLNNTTITLELRGPAGWNAGTSQKSTLPMTKVDNTVNWEPLATNYSTIPVLGGDYQATLVSSEGSFESVFNINPEDVMGAVSNIQVVPSPSQLSVSWSAVQGAVLYRIHLFERGPEGVVLVKEHYVREAQATLEGLSLAAGRQYQVTVAAYSLDFAQAFEKPLDGQHNVAVTSSAVFQP